MEVMNEITILDIYYIRHACCSQEERNANINSVEVIISYQSLSIIINHYQSLSIISIIAHLKILPI